MPVFKRLSPKNMQKGNLMNYTTSWERVKGGICLHEDPLNEEEGDGRDKYRAEDVERESGSRHLWDGDPPASEHDGVGRGGHRHHERAGRGQRRRDHQHQWMKIGRHCRRRYDRQDHRCGSRVRGQFSQKCQPQTNDQNHSP